MTAEEAPHVYAAIQKAISLESHAEAKERALIDALAIRYVEHFDAEKEERAGSRVRGRHGTADGEIPG